jgi:2-polyprenyl-3-methyl-5-hydroxy-6-metoxy-1,4-benzoquinol methylase
MKNTEKWTPSKFVLKEGHFTASQDTSEVSVGSRLIVDITAKLYQSSIPRHVKGRLLDLGCGKVPLYEMYKDLAADIVCVDWENSFHDNQFVDIKCDLSEDLPIPDSQFETIIMSDVLEHLPNPEKTWKELFRLLSPGGKILMNTPFLYWIHEAPYDYYRHTEFSLKRFAESAGFGIISLEPIGGAPVVLADISSKFFLRYSRAKWVASCIQCLSRKMIKTKWVKRMSEKSSSVFPIGYFLVAQKPQVDRK